ncbi:MAG: YihY/virulence factor BrkB family protein [Sphingomonadaceae bacterium]|nr:MAG: YihY/virulence factor BrkB family protein [Sphingomonadaceae bacterium]
MIDLLKRTFSATSDDNIGLVAAGVAFYGFLAFVPLLAAVVLAYGLFADPVDAIGHASRVFQILPDGAARIVVDQMEAIADTDASTAGFGLVLALGSALFGAMKGAKAVIIALNIVTGVEEPRGFLRQNGTALLITESLSLTALVALAAISLLPLIESLWPGLPDILALILRVAFWLLFGLAAAVGVALIYRFGPNAPHHHWRTLLPGALAATGGFLIVTLAFGLFVANFGSYNATYGALGAVVVLLMWLYLSAYVLLFGAELNVELR